MLCVLFCETQRRGTRGEKLCNDNFFAIIVCVFDSANTTTAATALNEGVDCEGLGR